jgi:hypothetical protein
LTFAEDADYAGLFNGETVPGDNTINSATHTLYKNRAFNKVMWAMGLATTATQPTDTYGQMKEAELFCYQMLLDGKTLAFNRQSEEYKALAALLELDAGPALVISNKHDDVYGGDWIDRDIQ